MWLADVKAKTKRKNQILFSKDSLLLTDLCQLIAQANRRALILWASLLGRIRKDLPAELGRLSEEISNQPLPSGGVDSVISYDGLLRYSILLELPRLLQGCIPRERYTADPHRTSSAAIETGIALWLYWLWCAQKASASSAWIPKPD